ncbi:50S ribosomal protein L30 [Candidatus Woesearchaeota archaeon]|jgi:large subunit ribosomal protein L30e|nr:50S ribosomal protein L30 [Candidatus Woesearchaeota archaeon]
MAKKKETTQELAELRKELQDGKLVFGKDSTIKRLKEGILGKIYVANNCPEDIKLDLEHYAELVSVPVVELTFDNEELGSVCKKHFFISVLGVKKG